MAALDGLKKLSINDLISRLHNSISAFGKNISKLTEKNREMTLVDIIELRNHLKERLQKGEETAENEKLLKLVELFKEDKNALELAKIDLDEWIEFLDAIKDHIQNDVGNLSKDEAKDMEKLKTDITKLQQALRRV